MGQKKKAFKDTRKGKHSMDANRGEVKGTQRTAATVRRLKVRARRSPGHSPNTPCSR